MLYLQFVIEENRYVLSTQCIVEILPYAKLRNIPLAPSYVSGLLNYRGNSIPVIDLCMLMHQRAAAPVLSTRIILVNYPVNEAVKQSLGLLIEGVTDTLLFDESAFVASGVRLDDSAYLGDVVTDAKGMIQRINLTSIIPASAHAILFSDRERA